MKINFEAKTFSISVTELTRLLISATIDEQASREESRPMLDAVADDSEGNDKFANIHGIARTWLGTEQHRKINTILKSLISDDSGDVEQEIYFKHHIKIKDWRVTIRGRIDVVVRNPSRDHYQLIEFKTTLGMGELESVTLNRYRLQVLLYALFFTLSRNVNPSNIKPILILQDIINDSHHHEVLSFTDEERDKLFSSVNDALTRLITFEYSEARYWARHSSEIPWPHDSMRPTQEHLMKDIQKAFLEDENRYLLVMAPTGFGKTAATLNAMLNVTFAKKRRLFILTAKKTQRYEYKKVLSKINQKLIKSGSRPIPFLNIEFTLDDCTCDAKSTSFMTVIDITRQQQLIDTLLEQGTIDFAIFENSCKYHSQLIALSACRVIIGDYNYIFLHDWPSWIESTLIPKINHQSPFLLLIDEIHNLPNRIESALAITFTQQQLADVLKDLESVPRLKNAVAPFIRKLMHQTFNNSPNSGDDTASIPILRTIQQGRHVLYHALHEAMRAENTSQLIIEHLNKLVEMSQKLEKVLAVSPSNVYIERNEEHDKILGTWTNHRILVSILHPSDYLKAFWPRFSHVVGMSATIEPLEFYRELLGFPEEGTTLLRYPSPFSRESRQILVVPTVDTRFSRRWDEARNIAEEIINIYLSHPARYLIVYPSFQFLNLVSKHLAVYHHDITILSQKPNLTREEREFFLHELAAHQQAIIQVVSGSIFTEGINLPSLHGIIIVSPHALPPTSKRQHLVRYLVNKGYNQREARVQVYLLPAISKMIQAAGRLLRHLNDRGVIVFLGKRFSLPHFQKIFPPFLKPDAITIDPNPLIKQFWDDNETPKA